MLLIKKFSFVISLFLLFNTPRIVSAQNRVLSGKVTDVDGSPSQNVSVVIKGTNSGTTTAADSTYQLRVTKAAGNILVFSFVGFVDKEKPSRREIP